MSAQRREPRWDVAIVGGGPAGCAAAITAAERGLRTVVIERYAEPRERVGESLHPGVEPIFRQLGILAWVNDAGFVRHRGHWIQSTAGEEHFVPFRGADGEQWLGYQAWRSTLDRILRAGAERAGACVRVARARDVTRSRSGRVTGVATRRGIVCADVVIDAAGDTHWLARRLGAARLTASVPLVARYGYVHAFKSDGLADPRFVRQERGWTWIARVRPTTVQWTRVNTGSGRRRGMPDLLRSHTPLGCERGADVTWRIAERLSGPGWLIAGDGAWVLDPSASHGVLKALMSGIAAAHAATTMIAMPTEATAAGIRYAAWLTSWFDHDCAELRARDSVVGAAAHASPSVSVL